MRYKNMNYVHRSYYGSKKLYLSDNFKIILKLNL